jgi:hypothetical protein
LLFLSPILCPLFLKIFFFSFLVSLTSYFFIYFVFDFFVCVFFSRYSDRLRAGRSCFGCSIPSGGWEFSLLHRVQRGSGAHPASYPMGTGRPFPGSNAAGA